MAAVATRAEAGAEKTRKRPRAARACEACRAKKYRCDELYPCSQCKKQKSECVYQGAENIHKRIRSSSYVADLEKKVEELTSRIPHQPPLSVSTPSNLVKSGGDNASPGYGSLYPQQYQNLSPSAVHLQSDAGLWRHPGQQQGAEDDETQSDNESIQEPGGEIRDINQHTKSVEYHGNTSSMSFLSFLQPQNQNNPENATSDKNRGPHKSSLVSTLHNVAFSPDSNLPSTSESAPLNDEGFYFRQSRVFLDGYFENLHFIHPILDREEFLARCEDLWFGRADRQTRSFVALYYSIISLGALVRVWDEDALEGMNRFQWSRKLFNHARVALGELRSTNDLETVQCLIFMAKVCQNELNPHLAYMYLGMAVRASLSAGHHREPITKDKSRNQPDVSTMVISKTWWGLYSLEVEMSFSLGRPDSLGLDCYHNRHIPPIDDSEISILPVMIPFARITREVSVAIYLSKSSIREKISLANKIEAEMDAWLNALPEKIRPGLVREENGLRILKDPKWARRQRLVLQLRYCNVKMVLYRPFLLYASQSPRRLPSVLEATVAKCVEAARKTIEVMHETFCHHVFFRTWWYNTTYIIYAASIVLCYATQAAPAAEKPNLFRLVDMTVEILEAMDECVVAAKAVEMIKQTLALARERASHTQFAQDQPRTPMSLEQQQRTAADMNINSMLDIQMPSLHMDSIFDFDDPNMNMPMDEAQFLFWTDLNGSLGGFGA